jgi:hypothetical protein
MRLRSLVVLLLVISLPAPPVQAVGGDGGGTSCSYCASRQEPDGNGAVVWCQAADDGEMGSQECLVDCYTSSGPNGAMGGCMCRTEGFFCMRIVVTPN